MNISSGVTNTDSISPSLNPKEESEETNKSNINTLVSR